MYSPSLFPGDQLLLNHAQQGLTLVSRQKPVSPFVKFTPKGAYNQEYLPG